MLGCRNHIRDEARHMPSDRAVVGNILLAYIFLAALVAQCGCAENSLSFGENFLDGRRAVGVKRFDSLEAPGLALLALRFRPTNGLPIGCEDQARAGIGDFDPVTAR